jgi:hypothetical protein
MLNMHLTSLTRRRFAAVCAAVTSTGFLAACGGPGEAVTSSADDVANVDTGSDFEARFRSFEPAEEPDGDPAMVVWPDFVTAAPPEIRELYAFHVDSGGLMRYIPCFCGCSGSGHRNNRDCYVREVHADGSITFDSMAPT